MKNKSHWPLSILGGVVSLMNLLFPLVLVRVLGPTEVGHYKIFFLYLVLVPWFCMTAGINNGLSHWAGRDEFKDRAFRTSWALLLVIAFFVLSSGMLASVPLSKWLGWSLEDTRLFVWGAFVTVLSNFFDDATVALGMIWRGALFSSGFDFLRNVALIGAAVWFRTITAVFWAHILVLSLKTAVGVVWGYVQGFQKPKLNSDVRAAVVKYAIPVSISAAMSIVVNYADQLILSRILDVGQFAIYSLGCLTVPPLYILEQAMTRVLIPKLSRAFHLKKSDEARILYRDVMSEMSWIVFPAILGMFLFAEPIVVMLFTERYIGAAQFLRVFAFSYVIITIPYDSVARARGDGKWILKQLIVFALISLPLGYACGKLFGAKGVMLAMIFIQASQRITALVGIHRKEGWPWRKMIPWRDYLTYVVWTMIACAFGALSKKTFGGGIRWLLCGGFIYSLVYFTGTFSVFLRRRAASAPKPGVILLTQYLGLGGLERVVLNLAIGLKEQGKWEPAVFYYDEIPGNPLLREEFDRAEIPVIRKIKDRGISFSVLKLLVREVLKRRALVIHSHDLGCLIYAVLAKLVTLGSVRVVHTQHSFIHLEKDPRYKLYEKFFTYFANEVTTVSDSLRSQYSAVDVDPSSVKVIPNGMAFPQQPLICLQKRRNLRREVLSAIEERGVAQYLEARIDQPWVLCMARIHPKKGQDQVLAVWNSVSKEIKSSATLVFVGVPTFPGELEKLQSGISNLSEPSQAIYAGFTQKPTAWLQAADIFISGSEFEGMPLGPIEAVGAGLKVLVSEIPGHDILPESVNRFPLFEAHVGASKLSQLILSVCENPEGAREHSWHQGSEAREKFGIVRMSGLYQELYSSASGHLA